jgi:hypothetical protein
MPLERRRHARTHTPQNRQIDTLEAAARDRGNPMTAEQYATKVVTIEVEASKNLSDIYGQDLRDEVVSSGDRYEYDRAFNYHDNYDALGEPVPLETIVKRVLARKFDQGTLTRAQEYEQQFKQLRQAGAGRKLAP